MTDIQDGSYYHTKTSHFVKTQLSFKIILFEQLSYVNGVLFY